MEIHQLFGCLFNLATPQMGYWYPNTKDQIWVNKNLHVMTVTGVDDDNFYITYCKGEI